MGNGTINTAANDGAVPATTTIVESAADTELRDKVMSESGHLIADKKQIDL